MKKSVYSLVLTDAVVEAADTLAYKRGVSRSALIDELLAQALSCMTPEMRMRHIFLSLEKRMEANEVFRLQNRNSDSMLSLFSVIKYKYKPTLRFSIELYRQAKNGIFGELKIQSRTQSRQLMEELEQFYALWIAIEREYLGARPYQMTDGKLSRGLYLSENLHFSEEELATAIGNYIQCLDKAIKLYFEQLPHPQNISQQIASMLSAYGQSGIII